MGETTNTPGSVGGRWQTRAEYEAWIIEARRRGQRERILRRVYQGVGIVAVATLLGLLVWANNATAMPMREPTGSERGLKEPDAAPQKGVSLADAKAACEKNGGHWLEEDGGEQMPNHKIIGCLFAVPKGTK